MPEASVIVWLAALPPKIAESPLVQELNAADVIPSSQRPSDNQLTFVVVVLSLEPSVASALPSQYSVADCASGAIDAAAARSSERVKVRPME
jgi:hypothetical protein